MQNHFGQKVLSDQEIIICSTIVKEVANSTGLEFPPPQPLE
jgi:hypothetical protein